MSKFYNILGPHHYVNILTPCSLTYHCCDALIRYGIPYNHLPKHILELILNQASCKCYACRNRVISSFRCSDCKKMYCGKCCIKKQQTAVDKEILYIQCMLCSSHLPSHHERQKWLHDKQHTYPPFFLH